MMDNLFKKIINFLSKYISMFVFCFFELIFQILLYI